MRWLTRLFLFVLFIGGLAFLVLAIVSSLAGTRGVREVPPPRTKLVDSVSAGADYRDAYQVSIPKGSFTRLDDLMDAAFRKGAREGQREREVMYRKQVFGLPFHTDYVTQRPEGPAIVVTTVVHLRSDFDRARWAAFKPIHRRLMPLLVGRIASSAVADTEPDT